MHVFCTLRRLQRHRPIAVRAMLLFLLAIVTFATMPKWVVHGHGIGHDAVVALTADVSPDHPDAAAATPVSPDVAHDHAHYMAGIAVTLPAAFAGLGLPVAIGGLCPPWRETPALDRPATPVHRPPIV